MITSPTFPAPPRAPDFVRTMAGARVSGIVLVAVFCTGPVGEVPLPVAVFATVPASMFAWVSA